MSGQNYYSVTMLPEWTLSFDIKYGSTQSSAWTNILQVRSASNSAESFPAVWVRPNRWKLHVRYGPSSYVEINQHPNPGSGQIKSIEISLSGGTMLFKVNGAMTGYPSPHTVGTSGVCASAGACPDSWNGVTKDLYFCKPSTPCADVQLRNLRFVQGPP